MPDDDGWVVRQVTGSAATRAYRCPGCDQEIRPATPHVVAWPAVPAAHGDDDGDDGGIDEEAGLSERRHWHTACWRARGRRSPSPRRSR